MRPASRGDGSVDLPLPPPEEEESRTSGVRFTENLPVSRDPRASEMPALPLETEPFNRLDPPTPPGAELGAAVLHEDDATTVDPPSVLPGSAKPITRLPLPAPPVGGTSVRRAPEPSSSRGPAVPEPTRIGRRQQPSMRQPRPLPLPLRKSSSPNADGATAIRDEQSTAVAVDPLAALEGPLIGGRYRLVKRVGEGGMGKVFKVTHAQLGKTFALKIIHDSVAEDEKARESFFREARLASSLSHPNIASVVDFGEDNNYGAFMVMEFLDGDMLSNVLHREKNVGIKQACDIMLQVAEALHYIHSHRIVHCDIKAENILLCEVPGTKRRQKEVKLLDFGLARSTTAQRHTGSLSGTPHYVAPERIRGEPPSPQSDIYGLGILFYELITGAVPWDGNVAQILCGHLEKAPPAPSEKLGEDVDPAVEQLILKALEKRPSDRHKDTAAFIYELRTVMDMLGYGRRHKRRGSRQKIVIERRPDERDELARAMFDHNRLPMAMLNRDGTIVVANAAFAKFVMGVAVDVEGLTVQATPLAAAWGTFERDLNQAVGGEPIRRIIEFDAPENRVRRLLMWLDPAGVDGHACFGIHPLYST